MAREPRTGGETAINIVDALRGQQEQLRRLAAQTAWIGDAPQPTLTEIKAQMRELKRVIEELEVKIQAALDKGE